MLQRVSEPGAVRGDLRSERVFGYAGGVRGVGKGERANRRENGADFYGLPRNEEFVELERKEWKVPESYEFGDSVVVPLKAGEMMRWKCVERE